MTPQEHQYAPGMNHAQSASLHKDVGRFMASVMGVMCLGLAFTALVMFVMEAVFVSNPNVALTLFGGPLRWVVMLAPLGFVWFFSGRISNLSKQGATATFLAFAGLMGVSLSWVPLVYSGVSMLSAFGVTAVTFGATAVFGYVTKKDMSGMGRFLFMAVIGLIIAGLASMFIPGMGFWVAGIGVLVFAAYTAYDTQRIRQAYLVQGGQQNLAVMGALELYLNFVNIFLYILRLMGGRD